MVSKARQVWQLAVVVVIGSFMTTLDSSLINVALDTITRTFHATLANAQWISSGYIVAFAAALPLSAWLSRRIGAGRLWLLALAGFAVASGLCATAPNLSALIVLRVVQGLAGAMLVPTGQAIIARAAGPQRMGRVLNTTKIVVTLGPAVGPAVGGVLVSYLSWHWLFLINLPVGALAILFGVRIVPRGTPERGRGFDFLGFGLTAVGLPLILYGITIVGRTGSLADPAALGTVVPGLCALVVFVWRSLVVRHPLLDLRLFTNRVYAAATASVFFTAATMLGTLIILPLYYQLLRGQSVVDTGLLMFAIGSGTALSMPVGGTLTDRTGGGPISMAGLGLTAAGIAPMALLPGNVSFVVPIVLQVITGFGLGLAAMPALSVAYKTVAPERLSDAAAEATIIQRVGGSVGIALIVVLLERHGAPALSSFHTAFGWLAAACCVAFALVVCLAIEERRHRG